MIAYSILESNRFKLNTHRGVLEELDINYLNGYIKEHQPELLIVRFKSELVQEFYKLHQIPNYQILFADALVYYTIQLAKSNPSELRNPLTFELVTHENKSIIADLVPEIFTDYSNHYSANPLLSKDLITAGYLEWAQNYVNEDKSDRISWLVKRGEDILGFATCSMNKEKSESEGVLYGVRPQFSGGGVYTDIINFTKNYFREAGFLKMHVSSQLQNYAVQKVWIREGFILDHAYYTFHLNLNN